MESYSRVRVTALCNALALPVWAWLSMPEPIYLCLTDNYVRSGSQMIQMVLSQMNFADRTETLAPLLGSSQRWRQFTGRRSRLLRPTVHNLN